jgi:hypothetical protein
MAMVVAACVTGAVHAGERLSFVACPIVRDTKTVPCWLSEYRGTMYFLTLQTDVSAPVNPPWLGHRVLVEGEISDEPDICGGRVLKPLTLSVLPDLDASCNTVLPAEDRYELGFEPPRPPGPSRGRLAFGDPAPRNSETARQVTLQYEFEGLVAFRHALPLQKLLDAARATGATGVRITGYRSASKLSDGTILREREHIGRERAEQVRALLQGAGLVDVEYTLRWEDRSRRPNGSDDAALRRVDVELVGAR